MAIAKIWKAESDETVLAEIAKEIAGQEPDALLRAEKAIQLVQDEYRYLSVNLELGGQVPAAPGIVARKRYGDCKDLSFLLVHLLKRLGISARPILVNTRLRKSMAAMLPMDGLFNHVVVEYQVQGQTRWVDATMKQQGGGALNRFIPDYGVGLPVDLTATRLIESPRAPVQASRYELKETILLDTTGASSFLSVVLQTKGSHAEVLRQQFEKSGADGVAGERLQLCTNRFTSAKRIGALEYRDDREANEFILAEVFEINGFLSAHQKQGMCRFRFPNNLVVQTLQMPEKGARRTPFSLPYPCNIVHTVVVEASTLQPMGIRRHNVESPFVKFNRSHKCLHRFWSMTLTLSTLVDAVPPDRMDEHRAVVEDIWQRSLWEITLPVGYPHPVKRNDFGSLPPAPRKLTAYIAEPQQNPMPVLPASIPTANGRDMIGQNQPSNLLVKHRRKKRSRHGENRKKIWLTVDIILLILLILFIIIIKYKQ
ncbi:MAG: transglutaminase-like domain-containing protein [Limisphaerales bacterium]